MNALMNRTANFSLLMLGILPLFALCLAHL